MPAEIRFFNREKLQRQLMETGVAHIGVSIPVGYPDLNVPAHLRGNGTVSFHVGQGMGIPAPVTFDDTDRVITWLGVFQQHGRLPVRIPYECIGFVKPGPNCGGGNGGTRQTA